VEELVAAFISAEDQNFSMFNFVNELNQEAEKLEEQAAELQQEMEGHSGLDATEDSQRNRLVRVRALQPAARQPLTRRAAQETSERLESLLTRCSALDAKYGATTRTLEALRATVGETFEEIGCNTAATRELLGEGGVNESNLLQYLALIEQRAGGEIVPLYTQRLARLGVPVMQAEPSEARSVFTQLVRMLTSASVSLLSRAFGRCLRRAPRAWQTHHPAAL